MNTPMNTSWKEMSVHRSEGPSRLLQGPPVGFQDFKKILQEQVLSGGGRICLDFFVRLGRM